MRAGQFVRIRVKDSGAEWIRGQITYASVSGIGVTIRIFGKLRGRYGIITDTISLMVDYHAGAFRGMVNQDEYEIQVTE